MAKKKRYSYIKNPFSVNGWYCFFLGLTALALTMTVIVSAVKSNGNISVFVASMGISALLFDIMGLVFFMQSLRERDRNHVFAMIGGAMNVIVLVLWVIVLTR